MQARVGGRGKQHLFTNVTDKQTVSVSLNLPVTLCCLPSDVVIAGCQHGGAEDSSVLSCLSRRCLGVMSWWKPQFVTEIEWVINKYGKLLRKIWTRVLHLSAKPGPRRCLSTKISFSLHPEQNSGFASFPHSLNPTRPVKSRDLAEISTISYFPVRSSWPSGVCDGDTEEFLLDPGGRKAWQTVSFKASACVSVVRSRNFYSV